MRHNHGDDVADAGVRDEGHFFVVHAEYLLALLFTRGLADAPLCTVYLTVLFLFSYPFPELCVAAPTTMPQMERLVVAAIEEQVVGGRPRDILEAEESFSLVSEYFMRKVRSLCLIQEAVRLAPFGPHLCGCPYYLQKVVLHAPATLLLSFLMILK